MKTISVRDLQKKIRESVQAAQKDRVVVTRHGKPAALLHRRGGPGLGECGHADQRAFLEANREAQEGKDRLDERGEKAGEGWEEGEIVK